MESATVMPGKSYSYAAAYVAPQAGEWQIAMATDFGQDKAVFVGQG